jgi:glycosyltransferase involved in cell wall biosynthesis
MPSNRDFAVSVITPVYNAEIYLRKAVESAVILGEVGEVILIEDASPDNALAVALELEQEFEKVKLFQHPDKGNHGAGASRNLGIQKASCDYIAFLDADDYYLPNRFTKDKVVFEKYPDAEGVYSCVSTHFYTEKAKQEFFEKGFRYQENLTLTGAVSPSELFTVLFHKHKTVRGEFCTNGITLIKTVFIKVGNFNTCLKLRQDIHLWRRLAGFCNLYAGEITQPTAMRGIHAQNRMTVKEDHHQYIELWWKSLKHEFKSKHLETSKYNIFEQAYFNHYTGSSNKIIALRSFITNVFKTPKMIKKSYSDFDFNFWKVFGRNKLTVSAISFKNKLFNSNH